VVVKHGAGLVPIENPQSPKSIIHSKDQSLSKKSKEHRVQCLAHFTS